jgi:pimeloyl-ACP methyl ester carboxylesterase
MSFAATRLAVNGTTLALRRAGAGEPVLFLHGTDGLVEWPGMLDTLAQRYDVVAPDHPGFGDTALADWMGDISDLAYVYLDAIAALGLTGIHVIGHSLGGWIALEMAVRSVERLRSLTLLSSAGIHVKGVPKADIFMIDPEEQALLAYADPQRGAEAAERAGAEKYQRVAILNRIASARFGWHPRFFNPRLQHWLHRVQVPTHIVWGEQDRIIPPAYAQALHDLIPGSSVTSIANAGHLPHLERPKETTDAVERFLRGQGRA